MSENKHEKNVKNLDNIKEKNIVKKLTKNVIPLTAGAFILTTLLSGYTVASWNQGEPLGFSNIVAGNLDIQKGETTLLETNTTRDLVDTYYNPNLVSKLGEKKIDMWKVADSNELTAMESYAWMTDVTTINKGDNIKATFKLDFDDFAFDGEYKSLKDREGFLGNGWKYILIEKTEHNPEIMSSITRYLEGSEITPEEASKFKVLSSGALTKNGITDTKISMKTDPIQLTKDTTEDYTLIVMGELPIEKVTEAVLPTDKEILEEYPDLKIHDSWAKEDTEYITKTYYSKNNFDNQLNVANAKFSIEQVR